MIKKSGISVCLCLACALTLTSRVSADEPLIRGYLLFEYWDGISGSTVDLLTGNAAFPASPTAAEWRDSFEGLTNRGDNYGCRVGGYIIPPQTGNYTFFIASDDASEIWISTDENWNNVVKVAVVPTWANEHQWNKYPEQKSAEINMTAGQRYYVDVFFKESSSGDNLAVAWIGPGIGSDPNNPTVISGDHLSPYLRADDRQLVLKYYKPRSPFPADASFVGTPQITLTWSPVIYATSHHLYVGESLADVTNGTGGTDKGLISQASYSGYPFQLGRKYYWRVDEIEADGITKYAGPIWSFTVALKTASVPVPPDGSKFVDPNVSVGWVAGAGSVSHEVYFGTDQTQVTQASPTVFKGSQTAASFVPGPMAKGVKHYWRVDEVEADGTTRHVGPVWSFTTVPDAAVTDPNLLGWWKLDESQGSYAFDFSGHGLRGTLNGGPIWAPGMDGGALDFDGKDDWVETGKTPTVLGLNGNAARTVSVWVYARTFTSGAGVYEMGSNKAGEDFALTCRPTVNVWRMQYWNLDKDFTVASSQNQWVHFAHIHDGTRSKIYANGKLVVDELRTLNTTDSKTFKFGTYRTNRFNGVIDDLRLYKRAVTEAEVSRIMAGDPALAWAPVPANGSTPDVDQASTLNWSMGDGAVQHDVYLDKDQAAVSAANVTNTTGVYRGRQTSTTYGVAAKLDWGQTYYWRVDEVKADGTVSEGKLWSFTVADYLVADDFEPYDDICKRIFFTWVDGTGYGASQDCGLAANPGNGTGSTVGNLAAPFAEQTIVQAGHQSMPFGFDNSKAPFYSETSRQWASAQAWNRDGVNGLRIYFRGDPVAFLQTSATSIVMNGMGSDIYQATDQFRFAYRTLTGDGSITARVDGVQYAHDYTKAGVMIREGLQANVAQAHMIATPGGRVEWMTRTVAATNAAGTATVAGSTPVPQWVRVTRKGNVVTGEYSADGKTWLMVSATTSADIPMPATVYVGLVVCSHVTGTPAGARFSAVATTGAVTGDWQTADIGVAQVSGNMPDTLYVAVQDSTGAQKVLNHPDSLAISTGGWQEWTLPFSEFTSAGVNMGAVQKLTLGVGSPASPKAGPAGKIWIDDIRLVKTGQ